MELQLGFGSEKQFFVDLVLPGEPHHLPKLIKL